MPADGSLVRGSATPLIAGASGGFYSNTAGAGNWSGAQLGTLNGTVYTGSAEIVPSIVGTYTYALTCGGTQSGFTQLTVQ